MAGFDCDIVVAGGGVAGLAAACLFGQAGFSVVCVDPAPPVTKADAEGADLRTTAFLQPARDLLDAAGLWARLAGVAMPLRVMRIVDAGGPEIAPRLVREFDAADISDRPFGWNLPNWLLRREMVAHLAGLDGVSFRPGTGVGEVVTREGAARVALSDGGHLWCRLVIAADGRASAVRRGAGIAVTTRRYGQKALAFAVTHPIPHENVSTEIHRSGGPFTLVPLPDRDDRPSSAVVWMETGREALRLAALDEAAFEAAMTERSCHLFGPLRLVSRRTIWPIVSQIAHRLTSERIALVAEAAHVLPPIGAQGLNMSLADLRVLLDLARATPDRLGEAAMLRAYHRRRWPDIALRVAGIDLLDRAAMAHAQPVRDARAFGLDVIHSLPALRRATMRLGLGAGGSAPRG